MSSRIFAFGLLFFVLSLNYGCSLNSDSKEYERPPSGWGDGNTPDPWDPPPTDNGDEPSERSAHVTIRVEANDAMVATWQDQLYNLLTPAKAYAFRGMDTVDARSVRIVQVNGALSARSTPTVDIDSTITQNDNGSYAVFFTSGSTPQQRMDLMVRVELDSGQILFAPLIIDGSDIKVNVVSDFLVRNLFDAMSGFNQSLSSLLPCGDEQELGCENQPEARMFLWSGLALAVQEFDTTIPVTDDIPQARTFLKSQVDFMNFVNTGVSQVLSDGFVNAIARDLNFDELTNAASYQLNSLIFSMGLANDTPEDSNADAVLFNRHTAVSSETEDNDTENTYPGLFESEFPYITIVRSITSDIPYLRRSITRKAGSESTINERQGDELGSFSSAASNSYTSVDGVTRYGRLPHQVVQGRDTGNVVGWLTNPMFSEFFGDNDTREYMLAAPVTTGRAYLLNQTGDNSFTRNSVLEESVEFNYMIHLLSTEEGNFDAASVISQKSYGVVSLSQNLAPSESTVYSMGVSTKLWSVSGNNISETQDASGLPSLFTTFNLSKNNDGEFSGVTETTSNDRTFSFIETPVNIYDQNQSAVVESMNGRVAFYLNGQLSQEGAISANGSQIATYINDITSNKGFSHGIEITGTSPNLLQSEYLIQGHLFSGADDADEISTLNGSRITIGDTLSPTLSLKQQYAKIDSTSLDVTFLSEKNKLEADPTGTISQDGQQIQMQFSDVAGESLLLQGFITNDGNLLVLTVKLGNAIGVIYGYKDQKLPVS